MTTKAGDQKRILNGCFLVATVLFLSLFSFSVLAADPGHGAGVIGANDFESGNYSFPDSVIVNYSAYFATLGGNVGIGTTTPTDKLTVQGGDIVLNEDDGGLVAARISSGTESGAIYLYNGAVTPTIYLSGADSNHGYFNVGNANFGIGTASPGNKLDVVGSINATGTINATTDVCIEGGTCLSSAVTSSSLSPFTNDTANVFIADGYPQVLNVSNFLFVNGTNVGIGTMTPGTAFQVGSGTPVETQSNDAYIGDDLEVEGALSATTIFGEDFGTVLISLDDPNNEVEFPGGNVGINTSSPSGLLHVATGQASNAGDLVFTNNGTLGIGTTSPNVALDVRGSVNIEDGNVLYFRDSVNANGFQMGLDSDQYAFSIRNFGNPTAALFEINRTSSFIGIGTMAPNALLHIYNSAGVSQIIDSNSDDATLKIVRSGAVANTYTLGRENVDNSFRIAYADDIIGGLGTNDRLVITSAGLVGIGSTSPAQKLDVVGSINATGYINASTDVCIQGGTCLSSVTSSGEPSQWINGTEGNISYSSGNVGIGTTSPNAKLEVNNAIRFTGSGNGNAGNINWGTGFGSNALTLYDGGNSLRYGLGSQSNEMQFFVPNNTHISFNKGGDLQASGTNELVRIDTSTSNSPLRVNTLNYGANAVTITSSLTNGASKSTSIAGGHYDTAEENVAILGYLSASTYSNIYFGGGSSAQNAATGISFWTAPNSITTLGEQRMVINSLGYLGVNDTSPDFNLETVGTFAVSSIESANGDRFIVNSLGNVGIGTTNPAEELEVVGTFNVTNGAYISNNLTLDSTINNATGSPKITFENGDVIITLG
ncbi:MAG: hypothetical protein Q8L34_04655 [Candidatus Woesearchaeota archaeon]|nr:hypothetical protein [Candidatus Woesearchaeota archaeon]